MTKDDDIEKYKRRLAHARKCKRPLAALDPFSPEWKLAMDRLLKAEAEKSKGELADQIAGQGNKENRAKGKII